MNLINFKTLENGKGLYNLKKATNNSAGFDLVAAVKEKVVLKPTKNLLIPCGFSIQMPNNFEAQVRPRSGLALKNLITVLNSPGTIDADYRGEICVILINHGSADFIVERGMRIAQMVFLVIPEISLVEVDELNQTNRGKGGFGSTGV